MISSRPYWLDTVAEEAFYLPGRGPLGELPSHARLAIIGGGIVGLACAWCLAAAGVDGVLLLERGRLLHEASGANGGGLWAAEQAPGPGTFYELGCTGQELIARFAAQADADLEHRRNGVLALARSPEEAEALQVKTAARRAAGLAVEWVEPGEACALEPALDPGQVYGAAWHPEDTHINPARLGAAFSRAAQQGGARVVTGARVQAIEQGASSARVWTDRGMVEVSHVVMTSGPWAPEFSEFLGLEIPIEPAKGQLLATAPGPPLLRHAVIDRFGLLQTASGAVISGGTVEFVGFDPEPREEVRDRIWQAAQELAPALRGLRLTHSWARFRPHTPDGLPLIGFCGPERRHLIAAGHFKNGLLLSAVSGRIVADLLTRGETPFPLAGAEPERFSQARCS
jgi:glycine oxidase